MRKAVKTFAVEMEIVLHANDYKGGWSPQACTMPYLRKRLVEELEEYLEYKDPDELPDIANFCMMLWQRGKRIGFYK